MKLDRPPYICAYPGDTSGCGYHRVIRPLDIMSRNGVAAGRSEIQFLPPPMMKMLRPDILVWQRQGEPHHIEMMKQYREMLPDAFFVYEVDDALNSVPDKSWHKPYMPPGVDEVLKRGVSMCDVLTVSTKTLARHMRDLMKDTDKPDIEIRVAPNMLALEDFENAQKIRFAVRNARTAMGKQKFRIGWGGGAGHGGDFDQMQDAFLHFGDRVEWVFLGFKPDTPDGVNAIYAGAVQPQQYIAALANLDLDLMVAPLEDNHFNHCKSNLRLIEGGACIYPIIASPVGPYLENAPPVYKYAKSAREWINAIESFMALSESRRGDSAANMNNWAKKNYCMDHRIAERLNYWLPRGKTAFVPKMNMHANPGLVIVCNSADDSVPDANDEQFDTTIPRVKTLEEACRSYTGDILYIREGTKPPADLCDRLSRVGYMHQVGTISFLCNDGGAMAFPKMGVVNQMDTLTAHQLDQAATDLDMHGEFSAPISTGYAAGPIILLRRAALNMTGFPMFDAIHPEMAIVEWSAQVAARGLINVGFFGCYVFCGAITPVKPQDIEPMSMRIGIRWPQPKFDGDAIASGREKIELHFHRRHYRGLPPPNRQDYSYWAAVHDTPSESDGEKIEEWLKSQPAIWRMNARYDRPDALNFDQVLIETLFECVPSAVSEIDGKTVRNDWIVCAAADTKVDDHFIAYISRLSQDNPYARFIYADHDRMVPNNVNPELPRFIRTDHEFKSDLDHHLLLGRDYVSQICAIRSDVICEFVPWVQDFYAEALANDKAFDGDCIVYAIALRIIELHGRQSIAHARRICAHITSIDPNKMRARAVIKARIANDHVKRMGWPVTVNTHSLLLDAAEVQYHSGKMDDDSDAPSVTIIVPTKNKVEMLMPCMNTILQKTNYKNYKILVIDNGSDREEMLTYQAELIAQHSDKVRLVVWAEPFNWSKLNNFAVRECGIDTDLLLFLNDDTRVLSPEWLNEMVGAIRCPGVGTVGARLLYPHQAVQHIGVSVYRGNNGHIHKGMPAHNPGYHGIAFLSHESSAVTGACMLTSRKVFDEIGGFPEYLSHNYNDTVFCIDVLRRGYLNVVTMRAELQHFEAVTRPASNSDFGKEMLRKEGREVSKRYTEEGPYWNPNIAMFTINNGMMIAGMNFDVFQWPALQWPWRQKHTLSQIDIEGIGIPVPAPEGDIFGRIAVMGQPKAFRDEQRDGDAIYIIMSNGYEIKITNPPMENCKAFDIRDSERAKLALKRLGIDKIIISSIGDAQPVHLSYLARLGLPIEYRPSDAESVCPRHTLRLPNGTMCDRGWIKGACQGCIDQHNTPHGPVSIMSWLAEWIRFFNAENVTVSPQGLEAKEFADALEDVFSGKAMGINSQPQEAQGKDAAQ